MALSTAQNSTLAAFIAGDGTLNALPNTADGNAAVALALQAVASPDFFVWKSRMTRSEIYAALVWTEVVLLATGKQATFQMLLSEGTINPADPNIQAGFVAIFTSTTTLTNLTTAARRKANRLEKLYATGTGSTGSPATMAIEGSVTYQDVAQARSS